MITLTNSKNYIPFLYAAMACIFSFSAIALLKYFNFNNLVTHKTIEIGVLMVGTFLLLNRINTGGKVQPFKGFCSALGLGVTYAIGLSLLYIFNYYALDINLLSSIFNNSTSNPLSLFVMIGFELFAYAFIIALISLQYYKKPVNKVK